MSNGYDVNDIAPPTGGDYWQPEVGDTIAGTITYVGSYQRQNNWGKTEDNLRIDLEQDDGETLIWTVVTNADVEGEGYAKRDAKAVAAAVRAAGQSKLEIGGRLGGQRLADVETKMGMGRDFVAQYRPPAATAPAPAPQAPAPAPAPAPAMAPTPAPAPAPAPAAEAGAVTGLI